ncbi:MAG: hypothetical protein CMG26_06905 [Candidatus Marinimicrobia bacterium]|mgnify:FL=1|nr:hypothetical protein [Candidatus Neomarinimicrobiota bacterium]|tara:strand:+ start:2649 stop:3224 length:576 start_codon:yes stop_codon:yes gene_type:complete
MLQKIIAFVLFLISISLVFYWNVIRDADKKAMNQLEFNDEQLTGDVTQTTEVYARLEKKWIGTSKHVQNLEIKTDTLRADLEKEIESTNNRFDKIRGDLDDYIRKQTKKNDELDKTISQNHKDLKKSIQKVNRDIKKVENKRIKPLETEIKVVSENKEKLERLMRIPKIIDWLEDLRKQEEAEAAKQAKNN